jgi:hypothetical protein
MPRPIRRSRSASTRSAAPAADDSQTANAAQRSILGVGASALRVPSGRVCRRTAQWTAGHSRHGGLWPLLPHLVAARAAGRDDRRSGRLESIGDTRGCVRRWPTVPFSATWGQMEPGMSDDSDPHKPVSRARRGLSGVNRVRQVAWASRTSPTPARGKGPAWITREQRHVATGCRWRGDAAHRPPADTVNRLRCTACPSHVWCWTARPDRVWRVASPDARRSACAGSPPHPSR